MPELDADVCKVFKANLADYSLLEIVHHVVGNELAAIIGYTCRLQRATQTSEQPPEQKAWTQNHEKCEDYLQIIEQKEVQVTYPRVNAEASTPLPTWAASLPEVSFLMPEC